MAAAVAVATPCWPAPVSAMMRCLPSLFASRIWPSALLILCAPVWQRSSRLRKSAPRVLSRGVEALGEPFGSVERRRSPDVVREKPAPLALELGALHVRFERSLELFESGNERFSDETPAEFAVVSDSRERSHEVSEASSFPAPSDHASFIAFRAARTKARTRSGSLRPRVARFDATRHVHTERPHDTDGFGDVFGPEPTREHDGALDGELPDERPVEGPPRPAELALDLGVGEKPLPRKASRGLNVGRGRDADGLEGVRQGFLNEARVFVAVKLQPVDARAFAQRLELGERTTGDDGDELDAARDGVSDGASRLDVDAALRRFHEVDAESVRARGRREQGVLDVRDAADFDPEGHAGRRSCHAAFPASRRSVSTARAHTGSKRKAPCTCGCSCRSALDRSSCQRRHRRTACIPSCSAVCTSLPCTRACRSACPDSGCRMPRNARRVASS